MRSTDWNDYTVFENGVILNKDGSVKKFKINKKGYAFTNFYYNGSLNCHLWHTVVGRAFLGKLDKGFEFDHIDNDRLNNRLDNLQILSKSENNRKSYTSGNRDISGDKNPNSKKRKQNGFKR